MAFDHMDAEYVNCEINSKQFPDVNTVCNFGTKKVQEVYNKFLQACSNGVTYEDSYRNFINYFPIFHIDVSHHPPALYENSNYPNIVINAKFRNVPVDDYAMFVIIYNIREVSLQLDQKKMRIIK
jgi:hypothetical protein